MGSFSSLSGGEASVAEDCLRGMSSRVRRRALGPLSWARDEVRIVTRKGSEGLRCYQVEGHHAAGKETEHVTST